MGVIDQQIANTAEQLGQIVRHRRRALGLTQAHAAARVGLLPKTVSSLETQPDRSQVSSLLKLLSALGLELVLRPRPVDAVAESADW